MADTFIDRHGEERKIADMSNVYILYCIASCEREGGREDDVRALEQELRDRGIF